MLDFPDGLLCRRFRARVDHGQRLANGHLAVVFNDISAAQATERRASLYDEIEDEEEGGAPAAAEPEPAATGRTAFWGTPRAPINSIIGGASLWVMNKGPAASGGRSRDEFQGVAEFFKYLSTPEVDAQWHMDTGYVPVRRASYAIAKDRGFYRDNPGADVPIEQLLRGGGVLTDNSRGIRLGGFVEIRTIIEEEMERAFQGQQTAEQALASSTTRGNQVLRNFQRANRG